MEHHSLGPTCVYHQENAGKPPQPGSGPPKVNAQFFYVSALPIDDPLSPLPPVAADSSSKGPPKPFSVRDHAALEEAWVGAGLRSTSRDTERSGSRPRTGKGMISFPKFVNAMIAPKTSPAQEEHSDQPRPSSDAFTSGPTTESRVMLDPDPISVDPDGGLNNERELESGDQIRTGRSTSPPKHRRHLSPFRKQSKGNMSQSPASGVSAQTSVESTGQEVSHVAKSRVSGRPFARAPSKRSITTMPSANDGAEEQDAVFSGHPDVRRGRTEGPRVRNTSSGEHKKMIFVPVGISRLHLVEIPDLRMKPIYWSPINDTSNVLRCTWFYKETMLPVPARIANLLEVGYEYIKPYADSYQDELQACIDNGASAETKIVYKLWPESNTASRPQSAEDGKLDETFDLDQQLPRPVNWENAAADPSRIPLKRQFETHSVIYADRHNAQILRPSALPSVRQNRRPLSSIRKGRQIGIAVVRGFDRKMYNKLYPDSKMTTQNAQASVGAYMSQSGDATTRGRRMSCAACENDFQPPVVSDLVLLVHGIGQKLSERVDSFHFTHAINGLRRKFNVELSSQAIKGNLRSDNGMMVLPVNWRLNVSFDDDIKASSAANGSAKYELKDITPDTLPAVRSIISDVMLDIPYYMSHHKDKMISAVVREANRVYRLWCRNNPGFQEHGRVHLIAHSLGSVMAMEILSKQPTRVPRNLKLDSSTPSEDMFEFDTTNLFCCGSPCGFFLLLNNAHLVPRKGLDKVGMEGQDHGPGVASEGGYGCLAVQNIYNISHRNDPVSYLMNASVDPEYAASIHPANIPNASAGLFARMGNSLRWTSAAAEPYATKSPLERPSMQSMPSTVEMDTHDFSREDVAEKRMYLLNENGQIDYYLSSAGGPLEIQYLSMLSAHSSYWLLQDFVRFLVVEIGRHPGKQNTVPVLRAVKMKEWKHGTIS